MTAESDQVKSRYIRRQHLDGTDRYSMLNPSHCMMIQEKERGLIQWIKICGIHPADTRRVLEIGCGNGANLLQFLKLGFLPENLLGNELIEQRAEKATQILPSAIKIIPGDALELEFPDHSFDVVFQSTVFTSILDDGFQAQLARRMWPLVKPGGGVLWYDFVYNNPQNQDVRGVPIKRIKELFPAGKIWYRRLTLAPPISRLVTRINPSFYSVFNMLPFLRTHVLVWIMKSL